MKFCNSRYLVKNYYILISLNKISLLLMILLINFVATNKIINFKNSLYLLDFKYYHTTEVIFFIAYFLNII